MKNKKTILGIFLIVLGILLVFFQIAIWKNVEPIVDGEGVFLTFYKMLRNIVPAALGIVSFGSGLTKT